MASADTATTTTSSKKKRRISILDLFFSRNPKRSKSSSMTETGAESKKMTISNAYDNNNNNKVGGANLPGGKPSLEKSRKKEVKQRLNAEASKEIRPLAVGTLAMMVSALSNQGRL